MRVALIDVDGHNYPNLVLMKLSAWHKSKGDLVEWHNPSADMYDLCYMAKVFSDDYSQDLPNPLNCREVVRGGTGYAIWLENGKEVYHKEYDLPLSDEIEHIYPDYSIYPQFTEDTAYGFLSRGCPRGCGFCHVAPKEGKCSVKVADVSEFWRGQKHIILSDPNILACKDALDLLQQLVDTKATVELNQGIDARLITEAKAELLAKMKLRKIHFAMDTMESMIPVANGLRNYRKAREALGYKWSWKNCMVFCLTNFDTTIEQDLERVYTIRNEGYLPYIMIYDKPHCDSTHRRLQRWCNCIPFASKFDTFEDFERANYKNLVYVPDLNVGKR